MAIRYYDEALSAKIKSWFPDNREIMMLKPDEITRLMQRIADNNNDEPIKLPLVSLSREPSVEILSTNKKPMSFDGFLEESKEFGKSKSLNAIPIKLNYQLDIFTRHFAEGDEYLREFIFKLINYPTLKIVIPYNNANIEHSCHIKLLPTASDNSDIQQRLFSGQFTRWTIKLEIDDAYLFSVPIQDNCIIENVDVSVVVNKDKDGNIEEEILS